MLKPMNNPQAVIDSKKNGAIMSVELFTNQEKRMSANAKKMGYKVYKHSHTVARKGIEYSNCNFIEKIKAELNYVVGERVNGSQKDGNGYVDSPIGNKLVDLFSMVCKADYMQGYNPIDTPKSEYYVIDANGNESIVSFAELEKMGIMQPAYFTEHAKDAEKWALFQTLNAEWEKDKANYPQEKKTALAKLYVHFYNKMFSPKLESIVNIK